MRIRVGFLGLSHMCGGREEKMGEERLWRGEFFVVGSSWCVSGFYEYLKIKYAGVAFHGVVLSRVITCLNGS
jgi:hypothetical protein